VCPARSSPIRRSLGLSPGDAQAIGDRLAGGDVEILCTRFARDPLSPPQRCAAVQALGPAGVELDVVPPAGFSFLDHSVLTQARRTYAGREPQSTRLQESADRVGAFLHRRLGTVAPDGSG
jgi:hypothetical protein